MRTRRPMALVARRIVAVLALVAFLVGSAGPVAAGALDAEGNIQVPITVTTCDSSGIALQDCDIYVYAGAERQLVARGRTDKEGKLEIVLGSLTNHKDSGGKFVDVVVRSHHPEYGLSVRAWSEPLQENMSLKPIGLDIQYSYPSTAAERAEYDGLRYYGSGTFRETRVDYTDFIDQITVGEMHSHTDSRVRATYNSSLRSSVQAGYKMTYPTTGTWSVTGSITRYMSNSDTWNSAGTALAKRLDTYFNCREENWEYQEEDGDIPGIWHTVWAWDEIFIVSHYGSPLWGANVSTSGDNKAFGEVIAGDHGTFRQVPPQNTSTVAASGIKTYTLAWTSGGFSASATTTYTSGLSWEFKNLRPMGGDDFAFYDNDTGNVWNVTSE